MKIGTRVISVHPNPVGTFATGTILPDPAARPWDGFVFVKWDGGSVQWTNRPLRAMCRCQCSTCCPPLVIRSDDPVPEED